MSPEGLQRASDEGDSRNDRVNPVQLQWEAVDAFDAYLLAWARWREADIRAMSADAQWAEKMGFSAEYMRRKKDRPPAPVANVVPLHAPADVMNRPYWP